MISLSDLRTKLRQARTTLQKLSAAPDRRRRQRWATQWAAAHPSALSGAVAPEALASDGFSWFALEADARAALLAAWQAVKAARGTSSDLQSAPRSTGKAFFKEVVTADDLCAHPAFFDTAIDEGLLTAVMRTMQMVPHLESIDVLASSHAGAQLSASQLWHYDVNDERIVKLFVYLEDCGPRNGPFTFITAPSSRRAARTIGHYVADDVIARHVPQEDWRVVEGAAGTAFLIDTGRCYHFGSRSEATRYAYVATYSSGLRFMPRSRMWADVVGGRVEHLSPMQRWACGLAG